MPAPSERACSLKEQSGRIRSDQLPPKRLEKRLEELARGAMPCIAVNVFSGNPEEGLTVGLWVETKGRRDVRDLGRVLETDGAGLVNVGWALLVPRGKAGWRLLLRVDFERPVLCSFVVRFDIQEHVNDPLRTALPLLLAASGFALGFDGFPGGDIPVAWIPAPPAKDHLHDVLFLTHGH